MAGIIGVARAMFLSQHDFTVVLCTEDALRFDDYADEFGTELETEAREHARAEDQRRLTGSQLP